MSAPCIVSYRVLCTYAGKITINVIIVLKSVKKRFPFIRDCVCAEYENDVRFLAGLEDIVNLGNSLHHVTATSGIQGRPVVLPCD